MKDEVLIAQAAEAEANPELDYETERGKPMPDDNNLYFSTGTLTDPATGIEISIDKVFERIV